MKKTPQQESLFEPASKIDFRKLLNDAALSENEQGIVKRRLLENRKPFGKVLQQLVNLANNTTIDISGSLKHFEEKEKREIRSFDAIAKVLSKDFPELLHFILDEYKIEAKQTRVLIGKEFIFIKRIADVIFEAKDKAGKEVIIHLEFERKYESDNHMDKRKLEYRHLMEMDEDYAGKTVLCNVFYLKGSPDEKQVIEDRTVKLPSADSRYSGELKYKAYHMSLMTIDTIIEKNLPFLLPFIVESEFVSHKNNSLSSQIDALRQQIDDNEEALMKMISALSKDKMDSLRTTFEANVFAEQKHLPRIEYLWDRSYSPDVFNKSTLLKLMREQLNLRQDDIQRGRAEGRAEGRNEGIATEKAEIRSIAKFMVQDGKMTTEQMEYFLKKLDEKKKD